MSHTQRTENVFYYNHNKTMKQEMELEARTAEMFLSHIFKARNKKGGGSGIVHTAKMIYFFLDWGSRSPTAKLELWLGKLRLTKKLSHAGIFFLSKSVNLRSI